MLNYRFILLIKNESKIMIIIKFRVLSPGDL